MLVEGRRSRGGVRSIGVAAHSSRSVRGSPHPVLEDELIVGGARWSAGTPASQEAGKPANRQAGKPDMRTGETGGEELSSGSRRRRRARDGLGPSSSSSRSSWGRGAPKSGERNCLAPLARLELATPRLEGGCSVQLSYKGILNIPRG